MRALGTLKTLKNCVSDLIYILENNIGEDENEQTVHSKLDEI